jgi:hypothetical protein
VRFPRDLDIRSGAFVLFGFVVVTTFSAIAIVAVACRMRNLSGATELCFSDDPKTMEAIKALIENIVSVLLALMVGTRPPPLPPTHGPDP